MKKVLAILLILSTAIAFASCGTDVHKKSEGTLTYDEFVAAELNSEVVIEAFVQAKQSWWDNKATVYTQDKDGAYFLYEMACSEEDYAKLTVGTKIRVKGYKSQWAGEVEIMDATFEILDGKYTAKAVDATSWLDTDELIKHQNELVIFKGMTIESISFKNDEPGDDIYVNASLNDKTYSFCVEAYLTGPNTDLYKTVSDLKAGDKVDIEGFLYWYNGAEPHITAVTKAN